MNGTYWERVLSPCIRDASAVGVRVDIANLGNGRVEEMDNGSSQNDTASEESEKEWRSAPLRTEPGWV